MMMRKADEHALVSVIVPVYNVSPYLDRCLTSITNQTYSNLEIILIDDGSTDDSGTKCKEWSKKDSRIVLFSKQNEGLGAARNDGIRLATGKYIAFIDSDDWWEKDALDKLYKSAEKYDSDIVYMNFYWETVLQNGEHKQREYCQNCLFDGVSDAHKQPELIFSDDARTWSKFYKRALFVDNKICFPCHPYEDFPINPVLVLSATRISQVHEALYHYECGRSGSITANTRNFEYICTGLNELFEEFEQRGFWSVYQNPLKKYAIRLARSFYNNANLTDKVVKSDILGFLENNCKPFWDIYKKTFSYYGSFAGYLIAQKNVFSPQLISVETEGFKTINNYHDADYLLVDFIGKENDFENSTQFIEELIYEIRNKVNDSKTQVIVLKLFYAEKHGIDTENNSFFKNIDEIKRANRSLKNLYEKVLAGSNGGFIGIGFQEYDNYTYEHTSYGCKPEFYNGKFYEKAFEKIARVLGVSV